MKLKYKKMIIMVSMCTMGIGLVTFSMVGQSKKEAAEDTAKIESEVSGIASFDVADNKESLNEKDQDVLSTFKSFDEPNEADAEVSSLAVVEEDKLEKNANKEINKLIKNYLEAKLQKDDKAFDGIVNDPSLLDIEDMARKTNYIESYDNIDVYTKKGPEEGSYIVYAYHEVKFTSIETLAPAMNEFFLKTDDNGKVYIYLGDINDETREFLDTVRNSEEVMELIYSVNDDLQKAVDADEALREFYIKLDESAKKVVQND